MRNRFVRAGRIGRRLRRGLIGVGLGLAVGCGAVYPEITPPIKAPPAGRDLTPPPPEDLLFITFKKADIPERTRDGRKWDSMGGDAPDAYAMLFVDDGEVIKTPVQANTLTPTWPDQRKANYRIPVGAKIRVELWDSNPINNQPICIKKLSRIHDNTGIGSLDVRCESGATIELTVEPAHARVGLGFYYELRADQIAVSRVLTESPAAREGIRKGDLIVEIQGKKVKEMEEGEPQSLINANAQLGVKLLIRDGDGRERTLDLKEGPIYPLPTEDVEIQ